MSNAKLLRDTLELTLARDDTFPTRFYERLFAAHPEVRPLFHRSTPGRAEQDVRAEADGDRRPHRRSAVARPRARDARRERTSATASRAEMYPWVGDALIATLREACGDAWTPEAERAWSDAYASLVGAILRLDRARLSRDGAAPACIMLAIAPYAIVHCARDLRRPRLGGDLGERREQRVADLVVHRVGHAVRDVLGAERAERGLRATARPRGDRARPRSRRRASSPARRDRAETSAASAG